MTNAEDHINSKTNINQAEDENADPDKLMIWGLTVIIP